MTVPTERLEKRLEAFLQASGLSYRTNARSYVLTCPLCAKKDLLYIFRTGTGFACQVCRDKGFKGRPEKALAELTGRPVGEIRKELYGERFQAEAALKLDFGSADPGINDDDDDDNDVDTAAPDPLADAPDLEWPYHCYPLDHRFGAPGAAYLEGRGIPTALALEYGVRYSPVEHAVAFPVLVGERLVGWQYRITGPEVVRRGDTTVKVLKAVSSPNIPRDHVVMFQHRLAGATAAVLCEGPVDAIKTHFVGGNVATMGKVVSDGQVALIRRAGVQEVYLALDPDAAEETEELVERFEGLVVRYVEVPRPYKDLGAMSLADARDCVLAAKVIRPKSRILLYFGPGL